MPDCSRKASVRVGTGGDSLRKVTRSTGWSISIPIPGRRVWRDMQAEMLEIITDVGHDKQIVRRQDPAEAQRELGAPDASG